MFNLIQYVPSSVCLECQGCCRFKEEESGWRPKLLPGERNAIVDRIFGLDSTDAGHFVKTKKGCEAFVCKFFNPDDSTCAAYHARPFECELYPFMLSHEDGAIKLYMHLNCPFIEKTLNTDRLTTYIDYLKLFFARADVQEFLSRNKKLLTDYHPHRDELRLIATVAGG